MSQAVAERGELYWMERMKTAPQMPLRVCRRRDIPPVTWMRHNRILIHEINRDMRTASGEDYEVIYDRATAKDEMAPGHHVYRVKARGGVPSEDILVLEFSCKHDYSQQWSPANAREPDKWLVEELKMGLHAARTDGRTLADIAIEQNKKVNEAAAKKSSGAWQHFGREADTFARKKRVGRAVDGVKPHDARRNENASADTGSRHKIDSVDGRAGGRGAEPVGAGNGA